MEREQKTDREGDDGMTDRRRGREMRETEWGLQHPGVKANVQDDSGVKKIKASALLSVDAAEIT